MRLGVSDRHLLCMDWDEHALRIVEAASARGSVSVRKAVLAALAPGVEARNPALMGAFIRRTLSEHRLRTRHAVVDIPRQDVMLNLLSLPRGTMDELAAMVHLQIGKELPFGKDQAVIDFAVWPAEQESGYYVWVAAVRNEVVDYYRQVLAAAGLTLERIGLRPYANLAALADGPAAQGRTLLADVGAGMTEIDVLRDGRLVFSRSAAVAVPKEGLLWTGASGPRAAPAATGEAVLSPEEEPAPKSNALETLQVEVSRTIQAYRATDPGSNIDRIILAGTGGVDPRVVRAFEERFGSPTALFEPPAALRWRRDVPPAPFIATIGLVLSTVAEPLVRFDFVHPKEPEAEHRERVRKMPVVAITVALFLAAAAVLAYQPFRRLHNRLADLETMTKQLNVDKPARDELNSQLAYVQDWKELSVVSIDYLRKLAEVFPSNQEGYITKLEFDEKGKITVELAARDKMVGTKLVDRIKTIKDSAGRDVFEVAPGNSETSKDPGYPVKDKLYPEIRVLSAAAKAKKKK